MVQSDEQLRLMCVHAHPDDESSKGAATMARYAREGVDVLVVTLTDGSRGSVLNPAMDRPEIQADITSVRAAATGVGAGAALTGAVSSAGSSRMFTPARNCASGDRNFVAIHRKM